MAILNIDENKLGEQLKGTQPISEKMVNDYAKLIDDEEAAAKEVYAKSVTVAGNNPLIQNHINMMNQQYKRLRDGIKMFHNPGLIKDVNKED